MTRTSRLVKDPRGRASVRLLTVLALVIGGLALLSPAASGDAGTFSNAAPIQVPRPGPPPGCPTIPDPTGNSCPPTPALQYPSTISVSGLSGTVADVNVTLNDLTYEWWDASDLDVMLVAPDGSRVMLMSDTCGDSFDAVAIPLTTPIDLTFDDAAAGGLPQDTACFSGTFTPTDDDADANFPFTGNDVFCGPNNADYPPGRCNPEGAAATADTTLLSTFNGIDPNGTWSLYVVDDTPSDPDPTPGDPTNPDSFSGQFAGGWSLDIVTTDPPTTTTTSTTATTTSTTSTTSTSTTSTSSTTTVASTADLSLTKSGPVTARVGRKVSYAVKVTNLGPATATDVVITDTLPAGFTATSFSMRGATCSQSGNVITCTLSSLAPGRNASLKIGGKFTAAGTQTNSSSVTASSPDPASGNNSSSVQTTVS